MESTDHQGGSRGAGRGWLDDVPPRPTTVAEALGALDTVADRLLAAGDARAAFPDIYAIITRRVAESVELSERARGRTRADGEGRAGAFFLEPRWISRLAGRFCERYLQTLRWSLGGEAQDAGAWDTFYATCGVPGTLPLEHVLLGLSAHINFDLAIGIHATIVELGATDGATLRRYRHDHDAVNDLLRASIPEAFDHLMIRHGCEGAGLIFHRTYALAEWAAMHILSSWRARVWDDALALLAARTASARAVVVQRMERLSRRYARVLSIPGAVPLALHAERSIPLSLFSSARRERERARARESTRRPPAALSGGAPRH